MRLCIDSPSLWIHRLAADAPVPDWGSGPWTVVARTPGETTVVAEHEAAGATGPLRPIRVDAELDHQLVGILVQILLPLAGAGIPIFALSTSRTDFVLVPAARLDDAVRALEAVGHEVAVGAALGSSTESGTNAEPQWFLVQHEPCASCGFRPDETPNEDLGPAIVAVAQRFAAHLGSTDDLVLRTRPAPEVWSPLEYACHVHDLLSIFASRVMTTLREDDPDLGWWDHEAAAEEEGYNEQFIPAVAADLTANARTLADTLHWATGQWDRPARRRATEVFTIAGLGRFALHEVHHHFGDAVGT